MAGVIDPNIIFSNVSLLVRALYAAGFVFILWLIFQIVSIIYNRKKQRLLEHLVDRLEYLDRKLNHLEKEMDLILKRKIIKK